MIKILWYGNNSVLHGHTSSYTGTLEQYKKELAVGSIAKNGLVNRTTFIEVAPNIYKAIIRSKNA